MSFEQVMNLLSSLDAEKRDVAAEKLNELLVKYLPVAEKEINSILDYKHRVDDLRGYDRPDRSAFIRDSIDPEVADTLSAVTQQAYTTSQQYYALKAKLLGKEVLKYHERNIPIVLGEEEKYDLEKSVALVSSVFNQVKPGYGDYVTQMFDTGKVDCYPRS
jgi:oligoendopeptidase F